MFKDDGSHRRRRTPYLEDRVELDRVTSPRSWDYEQFRKVLSLLGALGNGLSIPASNSPESIHVDGWRKVVNELQNSTSKDGNEHGVALFAEHYKQDIFFSDQITTLGLPGKTDLEYVYQTPQKHPMSRIIGSIHTHPGIIGNGLSATDYEIFLHSKEQQVMSILNKGKIILSMKTLDTPSQSDLGPDLGKELESKFQGFLGSGGGDNSQIVFDFNKQVCAQFGLTLYAGDSNRLLLKQVRLI